MQIYAELLCDSGGKIIDSAHNLIALNPLIHFWFDHARVGLEPIQKLSKGVRIALRFLPDTGVRFRSDQKFHLATDWTSLHGTRRPLKIPNYETCRPVLDGETVDVVSEDPAKRLSWELLELQWQLIRICALSGAGEPSEEVIDDDSDNDDTRGRPILRENIEDLALRPRPQTTQRSSSGSKPRPHIPQPSLGGENQPPRH